MSTSQLTIPYTLDDTCRFEYFCSAGNEAVFRAIQGWVAGEVDEYFCWLWGRHGVGCSHLLNAVCHAVIEKQRVFFIDFKNIPSYTPAMLEDLNVFDWVVMDHVEHIWGHAGWEQALFNLYNEMVTAERGRLLCATNQAAQLAPIQLEDLKSRMQLGWQFVLQPLSSSDWVTVLIQRAHSYGFELSESVAEYMVKHVGRCGHCLMLMLDFINTYSLSLKRAVTIPLVKDCLLKKPLCEQCAKTSF